MNKERMYRLVQANENYSIRTQTHQGRPHLVVPVVMMVEGVHSGSHGPLFHPREELGRYPASWDGIPVMIHHPEEEGENVSANSPELIDSSAVGRIYNTHMDGNKLRAEVWLDEERLRKESPDALEYIQQGFPLEVSVGVFTDEEYITGEHNGEHYTSVARNHRPDHLALLPGGVGACSWVDGCGIRTNTNNKKGGEGVPMKNEKFEALKTQKAEDVVLLVEELIANQQGYKELINSLQRKLDAMDTGDRLHYLVEVYDGNFIYEVRSRGGETKFYKRGYQVNGDGSIEFGETPDEVRRQVDFVALEEEGNKKLIRTKFSNNFSKKEVKTMSEKKKDPCCEDLVNELIANERTKFTDEDKELLLTMDEEFLTRLIPDKPEEKKVEKEPDKQKEPQMNAEQAMKVLKEQITKPEEFTKLLPAPMQDYFNSGLRLQQEKSAAMITEILDATDETWSKEELEAMRFETLEKVHQSIPKPVDYTGLGDAGRLKTQEEGPEVQVPAEFVLETAKN